MKIKKALGLIVNPIAGMGGSVGLKGTDGAETLRRARELGATPSSMFRAIETLKILKTKQEDFEILASPLEMGESAARAAALQPLVVGKHPPGDTSAEDTREAGKGLLAEGLDLLLFAGGDGTARDILQAVGTVVPVIGIPAGVKMHSAVFGTSPQAAGALALRYLTGEPCSLREAEVMDIDEPALRQGIVSAALYGYLKIPYTESLVQEPKVSVPNEERVLMSIARAIVEQMDQQHLFIVGPGTTTRAIMKLLNLECTLAGIDVVKSRQLLLLDAREGQLLELVRQFPAKIVVTPIGGQGYIFGRGNQPISSKVIDRAGTSNIIVVATPLKLASLRGHPLLVDTDDPWVNRALRGYLKVVTGLNETVVYPVL